MYTYRHVVQFKYIQFHLSITCQFVKIEKKQSVSTFLTFCPFSSVQLVSCVRLFVTPWAAAHQASLSITNSQAFSNSCPSSRWCHPTISSSVVPFSSCLQSFPASRSFPVSQFFASGGQRIGASASVLPFTWILTAQKTRLISLSSVALSTAPGT